VNRRTSRRSGVRAYAASQSSRKEIDVVPANESQTDAATVSTVTPAPFGLTLARITLA
jgi:hypothetical protein